MHTPATDLLDVLTAIPDEWKGHTPKHMGLLARLFYDQLCPLLGLKWVVVDKHDDNGPLYLFTIGCFFRTIRFAMRPLSAYCVGLALTHLQSKAIVGSVLMNDPMLGTLYIPQWARGRVIEELGKIVVNHQADIDESLARIRQLAEMKDVVDTHKLH